MATRTSPRLAAQRAVLSPPSLDKENLAETPKTSAGGGRPRKVSLPPCPPQTAVPGSQDLCGGQGGGSAGAGSLGTFPEWT